MTGSKSIQQKTTKNRMEAETITNHESELQEDQLELEKTNKVKVGFGDDCNIDEPDEPDEDTTYPISNREQLAIRNLKDGWEILLCSSKLSIKELSGIAQELKQTLFQETKMRVDYVK